VQPELVAEIGGYPEGMEEAVDSDEICTRFALRMIERKRPSFMAVYLTGLDTEQHASGPFSEISDAVPQRLDMILRVQERKEVRTRPGG
jgi:hypothetical protein